MDTNVYALLTPLILGLVGAEFVYCLVNKNGYYSFQDSMANLGTAIGHQCTNVFVAWVVFETYSRVHERWAVASWDNWLVLFLGIDFLFYWFHRAGHTYKWLWAAHAPHHSSEELNYTVGLRASVTQRAPSFLFYLPLAFFFPPSALLPAVSFHLILQLVPHTRVLDFPRWFEAVFNSPAHHRVHHGRNPQYVNKNYGGALIVWDKLFGTYEPEVEPVVYGTTKPVERYCPVAINLQYFRELPGELRPMRPGARALILAQLPFTLAAMLLVTSDRSPLSWPQKALVGAFVWLVIIGWGRLLEGKPLFAKIALWPSSNGAHLKASRT